MGIAEWAELHPSLSLGIIMGIVGLVVAILVIRDARKRLKNIYEIDDVLLEMFNIVLGVAKSKANAIKVDERWGKAIYRIIKDITGVDVIKYVGRDMTDKREIAKVDRQVKKIAPTGTDTQPLLKLIASAMVNNGYGIEEKELEGNGEYDKSKQRLGILRKVPSNQINDAINKCLDYIYILSNIYIFYSSCITNPDGLDQQTLAEMRNFIRDQENNIGDISKCLTELRIEIDTFSKGYKGANRN